MCSEWLVAVIRATFHRRGTQLPENGIVVLSEQFVQDTRARANWKAYVKREGLQGLESLTQVIDELRAFLSRPIEQARSGEKFEARWIPGGPWI